MILEALVVAWLSLALFLFGMAMIQRVVWKKHEESCPICKPPPGLPAARVVRRRRSA